MRRVFFFTIGLFFILQIVNLATRFLLFDRTSYEPIHGVSTPLPSLFNPWLNFDGINYLKIVKDGYDLENVVFFPLFPVAVRLVSIDNFVNPIIVGLSINFVLAVASIYALYLLVKRDMPEHVAFRSVILFLTFPTSFFIFAFYTESIFLIITLLFFIVLSKKQLFLSSVLVVIASLAKIFGVSLFVPLLYEAIKLYKSNHKFSKDIFIAPLGLFIWIFYIYTKYGDPLLIIKGQRFDRFSREIGLLSPITVTKDTLVKVISGPQAYYDSPFVYPVIIAELVAIIFAVLFLILSFKKIAMHYWLYCASYIVIVVFSGGLSSDVRYILMLFPIFVFLAQKLPLGLFRLWAVISFLLMIGFSSLFLRNYWIG